MMRITTTMIITKMMIINVPGGASDDHVDHEELRMIMKMMMM